MPRKTPNPTLYTPELGQEIATFVKKGHTIKQICNEIIPGKTPSYKAVYRWRHDKKEFAEMMKEAEGEKKGAYTKQKADKVIKDILAGFTITQICKYRMPNEMPDPAAVYMWMIRKPEFGLRVKMARLTHQDNAVETAERLAMSSLSELYPNLDLENNKQHFLVAQEQRKASLEWYKFRIKTLHSTDIWEIYKDVLEMKKAKEQKANVTGDTYNIVVQNWKTNKPPVKPVLNKDPEES